MNALFLVLAGAAIASWIVGLVAYLRMMAATPPAVIRLHCTRLRVRASLLPFACPQIFEGRAHAYRLLYLGALGCFAGSVITATVLREVLAH